MTVVTMVTKLTMLTTIQNDNGDNEDKVDNKDNGDKVDNNYNNDNGDKVDNNDNNDNGENNACDHGLIQESLGQDHEDDDYDTVAPGPQDSGDGALGQPTGPPSGTVGQAPLQQFHDPGIKTNMLVGFIP